MIRNQKKNCDFTDRPHSGVWSHTQQYFLRDVGMTFINGESLAWLGLPLSPQRGLIRRHPEQWCLPAGNGCDSRQNPPVLTLTMFYRFLPRNQIGFVPDKTFSSLKNLGEL